MNEPIIIYKTALAVFKDKKMIMVRSKRHQDAFFTLGGKIEEGETGIEALHREVSEEVASHIKEGTLRFPQAKSKKSSFLIRRSIPNTSPKLRLKCLTGFKDKTIFPDIRKVALDILFIPGIQWVR